MLQLNPAFERGHTLGELVSIGSLGADTARFFGPGLQLYLHQEEALERARHRGNYVVTSGTGSGKSMTYLVETRRDGSRVRASYRGHLPLRCWVRPDGTTSAQEIDDGVEGWFQPRPLLLCLRCRAVYDRRDGDFRKLSTLSQTGRSTATTILSGASIAGLRAQGADPTWRKLLSFTDNRQDAALQAGHLNDFVQVALLRSALARAVQHAGQLSFYERGGLPGVCVFVDGGVHDTERQAARDEVVRAALREHGFRLVVIRTDTPFDAQVAEHGDLFGQAR